MFVTILVGGLFFLGILLAVGQMQKRKFMRMARMDALTGILNRGAGQELGKTFLCKPRPAVGISVSFYLIWISSNGSTILLAMELAIGRLKGG